MLPAGFETAIPAREWPQIQAFNRAATDENLFLLNTGIFFIRKANHFLQKHTAPGRKLFKRRIIDIRLRRFSVKCVAFSNN